MNLCDKALKIKIIATKTIKNKITNRNIPRLTSNEVELTPTAFKLEATWVLLGLMPNIFSMTEVGSTRLN